MSSYEYIAIPAPARGEKIRGAKTGIDRFAATLTDTLTADIRVSDLPEPRPGDLIVIGADSFSVQGEPIRDRDRLVWTVELVPA